MLRNERFEGESDAEHNVLLSSLSVLGAGGYAMNKTAAECRVSRESKKGVGWQLTQRGGLGSLPGQEEILRMSGN